MQRIITILFLFPIYHLHAQNDTTKVSQQYYCSPCGCEYDDKDFDKPGQCPACRMRLLKKGVYNFEKPSVSANGAVVYLSNKDNNQPAIYYRELAVAGNEKKIAPGGMPFITRDGKKILYGVGDSSIMVFDLKTEKIIDISKKIKLDNLQTPAWDYSGHNIFFSAGQFPNIGIYLFETGNEIIKPVLNDSAMRYGASASPDGKMIAYRCAKGNSEQNMQRGIAVFNLFAKEEKFITVIGEYPSWSPDSKRIAFHWPEAKTYCIYTVNADGTGLKKITTIEQGDCELPEWSHDGKKIYFQTNHRQGNWEIWVMNPDGSDQQPLIWKD